MFQGIYPAIVTPFRVDESIDEQAYIEILKAQENAGVHGFYFCGTGGEGLMMTVAERKRLLEVTLQEKRPGTRIIVHVSAFFPQDSIELIHHAAEAGADAVALIPPGYYSPLDDEAVFQYYRWMTAESALPMMIYHLPAYSHYAISYALFERLMEIPNVIGIKDSTGDVLAIYRYLQHPSHPVVFNGQDQTTLTALVNGAQGIISGPANLMPGKFVGLWDAFKAGDLALAGKLQSEINQVLAVIHQYPLVPAIKQAMVLMGQPAGIPRRPSRSFSDGEAIRLRQQLAAVEML